MTPITIHSVIIFHKLFIFVWEGGRREVELLG